MHRKESLPYLFEFPSIEQKTPFVGLVAPEEFLPLTYIFIITNVIWRFTESVFLIHLNETIRYLIWTILKLRIGPIRYELRFYGWFSFWHKTMNEVHYENDFYYISIVKGTSLVNRKIISYSWFKIHEKYNGICHNDSKNTRLMNPASIWWI